jgi:hypothetical protein
MKESNLDCKINPLNFPKSNPSLSSYGNYSLIMIKPIKSKREDKQNMIREEINKKSKRDIALTQNPKHKQSICQKWLEV